MGRPAVDFSKLKVLVVENNDLMRRLLTEMLRGFGVHYIREASDVPEASLLINREPYDAVILDFFLGILDGGDFARIVRRSESCPNRAVPILLVTAMPDHYKVTKALSCGISEILAKPIAPKDLYLRLYGMIAYPRPFTISKDYIGPCRRRVQRPAHPGAERRKRTAAPPLEIHSQKS